MRGKVTGIFFWLLLASLLLNACLAGRAMAARELKPAEERLLVLVNRERGRAGCPELRVAWRLQDEVRRHSWQMWHSGSIFHSGLAQRSWSAWGENVGYSFGPPNALHRAWMASPGHRANILNCRFRRVAIGTKRQVGLWGTELFWRR